MRHQKAAGTWADPVAVLGGDDRSSGKPGGE